MNIFFIGSAGALSLLPFKALCSSEYILSAVGIYKPITIDNKIIALESESLSLAASQSGIPVIDLSQPVSDILDQLATYSIDVILMSCYEKRLPAELTGLAAKGCYNMHPSLLPRFRGPEPIFWQMKHASEIGVSWHRVVHDFDAGEVVAQQEVVADDGADYSDINMKLAERGAELMLKLLSELSDNRLSGFPQDPDMVSYYPYPAESDFVIDAKYSARQLYNFIRATKAFAYPYRYRFANLTYLLDDALDFDPNITLETAEIQGERLFIPCNEGVLIAAYTDKITA